MKLTEFDTTFFMPVRGEEILGLRLRGHAPLESCMPNELATSVLLEDNAGFIIADGDEPVSETEYYD